MKSPNSQTQPLISLVFYRRVRWADREVLAHKPGADQERGRQAGRASGKKNSAEAFVAQPWMHHTQGMPPRWPVTWF